VSRSTSARGSSEPGTRPPEAPEGQGHVHALARQVATQHAAAGGAQQLHGDLSQQPEADHGDVLASRMSAWRTPWSAMAPSVVAEASDSGTPSGNAGAQVHRHGEHLGVRGARAGAGHAVADAEPGRVLAHRGDDAGGGVADGLVRGQLVLDLVHDRADALGQRLVKQLPDLFGWRSALATRPSRPASTVARSVPALMRE